MVRASRTLTYRRRPAHGSGGRAWLGVVAILLLAAGCSGEPPAAVEEASAPSPEEAAEAAREERFFEAARDGSVEEVRELLAAGVEVDAQNPAGTTPLITAARGRQVAVVGLLLEAGAEVDAVNDWGTTALSAVLGRAGERGAVEVAGLLLDHGADPRVGKEAGSFVADAVRARRWSLAERLLERGAATAEFADRQRLGEAVRAEDRQLLLAILDPSTGSGPARALCLAIERDDLELLGKLLGRDLENERCEQSLPLVEAARLGRPAAAALLLEHGAAPGRLAKSGRSALMAAAREGRVETAKVLIEHGAPVNQLGKPASSAPLKPTRSSPLIEAVLGGHEEMVDLLLAAGADAGLADSWGTSALTAATATHQDELLRRLTDAGGELGGLTGERLQDLFVRTACNPEMARQLLAAGADPAASDAQGTPAIVAVAGCAVGIEALDLLLEAGVDVNSRDAAGRTPLIVAAEEGEAEIARHLLDRGAELERVDDRGWTALTASCADKYSASVTRILIDQGAQVEHRDAEGATPLMIAAAARNWKAVDMLVEARAMAEARDGTGRSAAAYFREGAMPRSAERRIETVEGDIRYTATWFQGCTGKKRIYSDELMATCHRDGYDATEMRIYRVAEGSSPIEELRVKAERAEPFDLALPESMTSRPAVRTGVRLSAGAVAISTLADLGDRSIRVEVRGDEDRPIQAEWVLAIMVEDFERENP